MIKKEENVNLIAEKMQDNSFFTDREAKWCSFLGRSFISPVITTLDFFPNALKI